MDRVVFFRRRKQSLQDESSVISKMLGLSLFVMLLAFFIVLNSITSFENKRIDPILQSLRDAFGVHISRINEKPSDSSDALSANGAGDTITQIMALLRAQIPSVDMKQSVSAGSLRARVLRSDLENSVVNLKQEKLSAASTTDRSEGSLLPILAALLQSDKGVNILHLDIVLNGSSGTDTDMAFLEKIAILLERAGVPKQRFSIAYISVGPVDTLDLVFLPYQPFSPRLELDQP